MKATIAPGKEQNTIIMRDNICYSHSTDLNGAPVDLKLSLMLPMVRAGRRPATQNNDTASAVKLPVVIWLNGGGWRGVDKNFQTPDFVYLAEAGFAVASVYYRSSITEGHFPDQLIDVLTAVRFLRTNAEKYGLDPDRIGIMGRSAGGHLASFAAMNLGNYETEEWAGVSSHVSACIDMFGPTDLPALYDFDVSQMSNPDYRWQRMEDTHTAHFIGGDLDSLRDRLCNASPINFVNEKMCPILILHGDKDTAVPRQISESFYNRIVECGLEDRAAFYLLTGAGHGTREFSQNMTKKIILEFLRKNLMAEA